jgi:hypothetical protein
VILELATPRVVTARSLARAIGREFDRRHGSRRDFATAHGLTASEVSRATGRGDRIGDSLPLRRVAQIHGYEVHPDMDGHYRRVEPEPEPDAPDPDDDVDDELQQLARDLEAEESDDIDDPMFADLIEDARHERFLTQVALDDATWARADELSWTPEDRAYHEQCARDYGEGPLA